MIQEAWIGGVSTRRVDELAQAMGLSGISKSTVSKLCKDIDERVHEAAKMLDIDHLLHRRPKELSGGQRQRVAPPTRGRPRALRPPDARRATR